ncbi:protein of unknown function UPF0153 [Desulforamulus reducens MI-1]|uniref:YkgJ family cysteine cluster protein n=1 Tax=Desulforamulus reducens (strain ATCC BAA-1160 / DSM 100696 / MI-1) TaxID=349161 RepID=A4J6I4_DESRM|nr:YkgJ family cysteine cluster protein [Desulforamulus reducens]ABO50687.1 protein of unknown function UPF0153 [Desulforamulus reducens MI-1]
MKVKVFIKNKDVYDLQILDETASVQDYLDAINKFIDENTNPPCRGCDECCWERIPLTSIDVLNYINQLGGALVLDNEWPLLDFLDQYTYIYAEGGAVDISLGFTQEGACHFLDQEQHICGSYTARSLVCQSFICMESTKSAQDFRSELVNTGMDELVRLWMSQCKDAGIRLFYHEEYQASPQGEDYPENGFTGKKTYKDVLLKEVCSLEVWNNIYKENSQKL